MSYKCATCSAAGKDVVAYCVETNKVMCRKCVGLLHYPGMKSAEFTIEELDKQHPGVQAATVYVMHSSVVIGMLLALWNSGIGDEYFKGASTCPGLSVGRQMLARFDANVFYYHKSSLATYCDIEDSFWRLLMDGWVRGVVSGSDSLLLLFSTLPKALMFKTMISTFLRPIYALLFAICGMILSTFLVKFEDVGIAIYSALPFAGMLSSNSAGGNRLSKLWSRIWGFPSAVKQRLTTKSKWPEQLKLGFMAMGLSTLLRVAVHGLGFHRLAALGTQEMSTWQLMFEPLVYFYLAHLCGLLSQKLGKTLWKKAAVAPTAPLTLPRTRPNKDFMEWVSYSRSRLTRSYGFYRQQAQDILHILVDDIFNIVVMLRVLSIVFDLAPWVRMVAMMGGLGSMVQRHSAWFYEATGFSESDAGAMYVTDKLLRFGFSEMFMGVKMAGHVVGEEAVDVALHPTQIIWRALVPIVLFALETKWAGKLQTQQAAFKQAWKGKDWKDGAYADMQERFGTFWNQVDSKDDWVPPKAK